MQITATVMQQLTSGSDLDRAAGPGPPPVQPTGIYPSDARGVVTPAGSDFDQAQGNAPWPGIINGANKFFIGARPSNYVQVAHHNTPGNYGFLSSLANFLFRGAWVTSDTGSLGIGLYPGAVPNAKRPMWNNLVPIVWGLRDLDPKQQAQLSELMTFQQLQVTPMEYTPPGSASLSPTLL